MNPEFLRMGTAVRDFLEPDKVVFGTADDEAAATLRELYAPILERAGTDLVETDIREAELIKYANNAFLASKVSLVNELGNIAREYGADAYEVLEAVGLDERISERFMRSGLGWGGSCFPKDVNALRPVLASRGTTPNSSMRPSRSTTSNRDGSSGCSRTTSPCRGRESRCWVCRSSPEPTMSASPVRST